MNGGCVALDTSTCGGSPGDPAGAKRSRSSVGSQGATFTRRLRRAAIGRCLEARLRFAPGASSTGRGSRRPYRPPDGGLPLVTRAPRLAKSAVGVPGARYVHGWPARAWISSHERASRPSDALAGRAKSSRTALCCHRLHPVPAAIGRLPRSDETFRTCRFGKPSGAAPANQTARCHPAQPRSVSAHRCCHFAARSGAGGET